MKELYLSILRDQATKTARFRHASDHLSHVLCAETLSRLADNRIEIQTPVGTTMGVALDPNIMLVPILRAGLALLPAFTEALPRVPVGILGLERDEETAQARIYYKKFPQVLPHRAIILDPMLATGGSACLAVEFLVKAGYAPECIYFTGVIATRIGFNRLAGVIPERNISVGAVDPELNIRKYIVPGLGDYGDRYFGTN